jgi:hypothetical protein
LLVQLNYEDRANSAPSINQFNRKTGHRIKYAKVDADTGEEVANEDIFKGYKVDTATFIEVTKEESSLATRRLVAAVIAILSVIFAMVIYLALQDPAEPVPIRALAFVRIFPMTIKRASISRPVIPQRSCRRQL